MIAVKILCDSAAGTLGADHLIRLMAGSGRSAFGRMSQEGDIDPLTL